MERWCLRLYSVTTGAVRFGDALYRTIDDAERDADAWNALDTGERAEPALHPAFRARVERRAAS